MPGAYCDSVTQASHVTPHAPRPTPHAPRPTPPPPPPPPTVASVRARRARLPTHHAARPPRYARRRRRRASRATPHAPCPKPHAPCPTPHAPRPTLAQGVNDKIHRKPSIVFTPKSLVPPVVVPLAAVVLVRVHDAQASATLKTAQVVVNNVVAPAIQFVARLRRTIGKAEERAIQRV